MKKLLAVFSIMLITLSGCKGFDYDMMVCSYHGMQSLSYEVRYEQEKILNIAVVEYQDLRNVSDKEYEKQLKTIEKLRDEREEYSGIKTSLENNDREITLYTEINYEKYNCNKDSLSLLQVKLQKKDFKDVQTLREKLLQNRFDCDEIVAKDQQ